MAKQRPDEPLVDYYEILGIPKNATDKQVQRAFRDLARRYHPDVNQAENSAEVFKQLVDAYQILKDQEKRNNLDARIIAEFCKSVCAMNHMMPKESGEEKPPTEFLRLLKGHRKKNL